MTKFYTARITKVHTTNSWTVVSIQFPSGKTLSAITKKPVDAPLDTPLSICLASSVDGKGTYFNGYTVPKSKEQKEYEAMATAHEDAFA